ncbi:MAG: DUF1365 family protein [Hyphomicrobiaceae bacterium]|nr:DUF1365 family protein [Hyphomicrobiaceae bacterium]
MMANVSAIYVGRVVHKRLRPRRHDLAYRCFWLYIDLDELGAISRSSRLLGINRASVYGLLERDHGDSSERPLRSQIQARLDAAGIATGGGPIRLLTMPRILGYGFNPLSIYFCHRAGGSLAAVLYEVSNTFGERHSYLVPVRTDDVRDGAIHQRADKRFYVSPFLDLDLTYRFRLTPPADSVSVVVEAHDAEGPLLVASLAGERRPLDDGHLARLLVTHPLLTLKVVSAIHWEALQLVMKRIPVRPRPSPPAAPVTLVTAAGTMKDLHDKP